MPGLHNRHSTCEPSKQIKFFTSAPPLPHPLKLPKVLYTMYLSDSVSQCAFNADFGHREARLFHLVYVLGPDLNEHVNKIIVSLKKMLHGGQEFPVSRNYAYNTFLCDLYCMKNVHCLNLKPESYSRVLN